MKMKISALTIILAFMLAGCNTAPLPDAGPAGTTPPVEVPVEQGQFDGAEPSASPNGDEALPLPSDLPTALASSDDIDNNGGYLLIGELPEEDIALYCDNAEERDHIYIRYGDHFQSFDQKAWLDPTILPVVEWKDWDDDGTEEMVVAYLRHEGTYFDGETTSPGLVCEQVVYQWDRDKEYWTDIHFYSGGGLRQG